MSALRIAVCAPHVPLASGGMERLTQELWRELRVRGHLAELVRVPYTPYSRASLLRNVVSWRLIELQPHEAYGFDMAIATAFPSYFLRHPRKVTWLISQYRQAYDLNATSWADAEWLRDEAWRAALAESDRIALAESAQLFTISANVSDRLRRFNGLDSVPLHPPPPVVREASDVFGDTVLAIGRLDGLKRHSLLIDAMSFVHESVRCLIVGTGLEREALQERIDAAGLDSRVQLTGWVDDDALRRLYAEARVVFYGPLDEDLGLVALEAMAAGKPVIALSDSGGVLEFVSDGITGWVVDNDARAVAAAIDSAFGDETRCRALGAAARARVAPMTWDRVVDSLLAAA